MSTTTTVFDSSGPLASGWGRRPAAQPMRTADIYTAREVLRIRRAVEQSPSPDEPGEYFWAELLRECGESDVLEAAWEHYRTQTRPVWPADILGRVRCLARQRRDSARDAQGELLQEREATRWEAPVRAAWIQVFDTEIGRGAAVEDARDLADAARTLTVDVPAGLTL